MLLIFYDIGKIAIPDTILNKPSKLSEEEFSIIKEHTIIGANILKNILTDHVQEIVRNHHERYDGNGYPDGLKGKRDSTTKELKGGCWQLWCYEFPENLPKSTSAEKIIQELENNKGTQFDPEVTDTF